MLILDVLAEIPDPRRFNTPHELSDILFVSLAAMLCGADSATDIALFTKTRLELLRQFVPLKNGAPSHDTFSRVFRMLDPEALKDVLESFATAFGTEARRPGQPGHLAVDGKSLRRAYDKGRAHVPPLIVTLFDCHTFMSLAQHVAEAGKGGEAQAAIDAINLLLLKGKIVSADALHCHRRMTKTLIEAGADYIIGIKANQSKLHREAVAALDRASASPLAEWVETEDSAHGRNETRRCLVTEFAQTPSSSALVGLRAVARITQEREANGTVTTFTRTFALSRPMPPKDVMVLARSHWAIENNLHWTLDVIMAEDEARTRKDYGPVNMAVLRRITLNVLRGHPDKLPMSQKRNRNGWDHAQFLTTLTHMQ